MAIYMATLVLPQLFAASLVGVLWRLVAERQRRTALDIPEASEPRPRQEPPGAPPACRPCPLNHLSQDAPHPPRPSPRPSPTRWPRPGPAASGRGPRPCSDGHPEVAERPEAAVRLIYEEVLLRRDLGDEPPEAEILARFPRWRDELAILLACDRLVQPVDDPDATASWPHPDDSEGPWPEVGERLGGFRLLARLGSGAMGHTFLASDPGLADRPVVLKLTPRGLDEHVSLARLQHTHIVPLYAAPEFPGATCGPSACRTSAGRRSTGSSTI